MSISRREAARRSAAAWLASLLLTSGTVFAAEPILPIPLEVKLDAKKVALGDKLFHDKRFSADNTIACASCHGFDKGGADGLPVPIGIKGVKGPINVPTVFNSGFNFRQFWDGRAESLEIQMDGPVHDPKEMDSNWVDILVKLGLDDAMLKAFKESYPDGLQEKNIHDAIATFERSLITPNARFDKYLRGDQKALSDDELQGYRLFKQYGCIACHQGVNVGGNMFQQFGIMGDYFKQRGNPTEADLGRFSVTKNPADKHFFKVPSLRNIALTAPYFHDGSAATLGDAVDVMFKYQLGRSAPDQDKTLIVKFLRTLTGELRGQPLDAAAQPITAAQGK